MGNLKVIASKNNYIDTRAVDALKKIAKLDDIKSVVALPDLSVGNVPNGVAIITKERIYPHLIGGDIGCGMALFEIKIDSKKVKIDKFEKALKKILLKDIEVEEKLKYNLGTIGKGNHFAECLVVNQIFCKEFEEKRSSLFLLVHSGSRAYGQIVFNRVSGKYNPNEGLSQSEAKEYLKEHNIALEYAKKGREVIAKRLLIALKIKGKLELISDTAHNSIIQTKDGWLHRKGATPTNKGLVAIAGSRGSLSYLLKPSNNTNISNYSLSHGAGRKWERSKAEAKLKMCYKSSELKRSKIGSRVVCDDKSLLYQEAPEAYKDIEVVINDLVESNLASKVASFRPILTYKE